MKSAIFAYLLVTLGIANGVWALGSACRDIYPDTWVATPICLTDSSVLRLTA